jgi:hypothetical protein
MHQFKSRDPNCLARNLTKWFGFAFTLDKPVRLVGQHNADSEEELLAHFRSVASEPWRIHYWPPGPSPNHSRSAPHAQQFPFRVLGDPQGMYLGVRNVFDDDLADPCRAGSEAVADTRQFRALGYCPVVQKRKSPEGHQGSFRLSASFWGSHSSRRAAGQ